MNEQDMLQDLGDLLDPPGRAAPDRLRERVLRATAAQSARRRGMWGAITGSASGAAPAARLLRAVGGALRPGLGTRRVGLKFALVGGLAAVIAAGMFAMQTSRVGGLPPVANAEAGEVLHGAADSALQVPGLAARPEQFVYVESVTWYPKQGEPGQSTVRSWLSVDGTRDGLISSDQPDRAGGTDQRVPGCRDGRAAEWEPDGTLSADRTRPCAPEPGYLTDMPTDPVRARAKVYADTAGGDRDQQAFVAVGVLLTRGYLAPAARAALFTAAATIPGVQVVRDVADAAGRLGIAVARTDRGVRYELVFDPTSHELRGWQQRPVDGGMDMRMLRPVAFVRVAVVDRAGQVP
ncbi:CU044_5270 family protein [Longispora sp. K20-0274]|uniref:CU044_5270 family protein n=1 Tax=Longispora sp. K20-0274 TaxID=3088255 RepID=UPI00399A6F3E